MQADKGPNFINHLVSAERRDKYHQVGRAFSRWARGGMVVEEDNTSLDGLARRGLAGATKPQSAQAIVEFLLVSVPLLALLFGILEFGLVFFESTNLDFVTREMARTVAVCATSCDKMGSDNITPIYRDFPLIQRIENYNLNFENLEYVLIQHVGEQQDIPVVIPNQAQTIGRVGPDTYADYQYHWQLYAPSRSNLPSSNPRYNTVPARSGANNPSNLKLNDALPSQIPILGSLPMNPDGSNANYNGYRSNSCSASTDPTSVCRKNIPAAKADGSANASGTPTPIWGGRYQCVPTDRFYVQIVYRHTWITPFLPTVNATGRTQTLQGFNANSALFMSSKIYEKIEPTLYSQSNC